MRKKELSQQRISIGKYVNAIRRIIREPERKYINVPINPANEDEWLVAAYFHGANQERKYRLQIQDINKRIAKKIEVEVSDYKKDAKFVRDIISCNFENGVYNPDFEDILDFNNLDHRLYLAFYSGAAHYRNAIQLICLEEGRGKDERKG